MSDITIKFNRDDNDLKNAIKSIFGDEVDFFEAKGFDGSEFIFVAVLPIAALTVQVIDFFMTHFSQKRETGRVVIKEGREVILEGYSADDVKTIIESIMVSDNEDEED